MPHVDIHRIKGGSTTGLKNTLTGKAAAKSITDEGKSLRDLTWLTTADVKFLAAG